MRGTYLSPTLSLISDSVYPPFEVLIIGWSSQVLGVLEEQSGVSVAVYRVQGIGSFLVKRKGGEAAFARLRSFLSRRFDLLSLPLPLSFSLRPHTHKNACDSTDSRNAQAQRASPFLLPLLFRRFLASSFDPPSPPHQQALTNIGIGISSGIAGGYTFCASSPSPSPFPSFPDPRGPSC